MTYDRQLYGFEYRVAEIADDGDIGMWLSYGYFDRKRVNTIYKDRRNRRPGTAIIGTLLLPGFGSEPQIIEGPRQ